MSETQVKSDSQMRKTKKSKEEKIASIYSKFAQNHIHILEKAVEDQKAINRKRAQNRRQVKQVDEKVDNQIKGKNDLQYLIKMKEDPDYYEYHRRLFIDALAEARKDLSGKPEKERLERSAEDQREERERITLLERHK